MSPIENPAIYILILTGASLFIKLVFILRCYCKKIPEKADADDDSDLV